MGKYKLFNGIIHFSESDDWDNAKLEWKLFDIFYSDNPISCLCGHYPIKELCELVNIKNNNHVIVGNCCVNKFTPIKSGKLFKCTKKVKKDIESSLNPDIIDLAYERGRVNDWERNFYIDIWRKRKLTGRQTLYKLKINIKVLSMIKVGGQRFVDEKYIGNVNLRIKNLELFLVKDGRSKNEYGESCKIKFLHKKKPVVAYGWSEKRGGSYEWSADKQKYIKTGYQYLMLKVKRNMIKIPVEDILEYKEVSDVDVIENQCELK